MDFIKIYAAEIIATIALIQPWALYLWKRFIKPGSIDFFETGAIEIGYSSFASTIGINGTLRALSQDFYIREMKLELTKKKDSSKHTFDWAIFRDTKISLYQDKTTQVELPYGFLLSTKSPHRVNIQFHDLKQQEDLRPIFNNLKAKWASYLEIHYPTQNRISDSENNYHLRTNELHQKFVQTNDSTDSYAKFNREFYWEKGDYELTLKISTASPNKTFSKKWKFTLTEDNAEHVRLNNLYLVDVACDQTVDNYNFAYPRFQ